MIYRTAPYSSTLNPRFKGHAIILCWISQKRQAYEMQAQFQRNTNRNLHMPYSTVSFRMIVSDLEWLSEIIIIITRSSAIADKPRYAVLESCWGIAGRFVRLEWCGDPIVKKFQRYVCSFWHDPRTWQTDRQTEEQTDTAWQHRPRLHSVAR